MNSVRSHRMAVSALLGVLATAGGCETSSPDFDAQYPEGTCMVVKGSGDLMSEFGNAPCAEPHTHIVIARVAAGAACPDGTDDSFILPGRTYTTWCLKEDLRPVTSPAS